MTQQLFFRSSHFFRAITFSEEILFQNNFFFRIDSFSRVKLLLSSHVLRKSSFPEQLLCRNSYFVRSVTLSELLLWEELVPNKDICRRATFSNHVLLHKINFFRIDIFSTKVLISEQLRFWKKLIFQKDTIPKCIRFLESYFFRAATFSEGLSFP